MNPNLAHDAKAQELSGIQVGMTLASFYEDDTVWHERLVIWPSMDDPVSWYILTPDLDLYVEKYDLDGSTGPKRVRMKGVTFQYWSRFRERVSFQDPGYRWGLQEICARGHWRDQKRRPLEGLTGSQEPFLTDLERRCQQRPSWDLHWSKGGRWIKDLAMFSMAPQCQVWRKTCPLSFEIRCIQCLRPQRAMSGSVRSASMARSWAKSLRSVLALESQLIGRWPWSYSEVIIWRAGCSELRMSHLMWRSWSQGTRPLLSRLVLPRIWQTEMSQPTSRRPQTRKPLRMPGFWK